MLVHHGLFWGSGVRSGGRALKRRLQILFDAGIALAAYHLPLDAHPELGNNALLGRRLGAAELEPFAAHHGTTIGFIARLPDEEASRARSWASACARSPAASRCGSTSAPSRSSAWRSSRARAGDYIAEALAAGADGLLTGEAPERSMADAREAGIHLFAAGHYATETFGIRALGEHLAERFSLAHVFIDVPNPAERERRRQRTGHSRSRGDRPPGEQPLTSETSGSCLFF